ncbi:restriction endonuclease subunit S [Limnospira fusiformis PMC 851.14]|uniref:Restriction endonuclease subunit S n=1 Tax=Limnospira fusiformis PMC 851.14 TaxID=2219512 RepID=A0ABU9EJC8_LIMFS
MGLKNWRTLKLGDVVTLQRGHDLPEPTRKAGNVPVLGSFGITGYHNVAKAKSPGVTVGRSGASFGVVNYSNVDYWPLNTALYVVDFHGNDEKFVYYFLKSIDFKRYNSGSAQPSLNRNFIHPIPVRIPPLEEQKAIAHILGTLDDKIELNQQMNRTLEAIARAIFKSWFIDFDPVRAKMDQRQPAGMDAETAALFPDEFEDSPLGKIPKGWEILTLGDLGKIVTGKTPSTKIPEYFGGDVPFITPTDMDGRKGIAETARYLTKQGVQAVRSIVVPGGSIAVSCIGSNMGKVIYILKDSVTNQQINSIIVNDKFSKEYLYYNLSDRRIELQNMAGGGSAVPILNKSHFSAIEILIPNLVLLNRFDKIAHYLTVKNFHNDKHTQALSSIRDTLLPKLLSGEIRVKDAEKIVEEVV